MFDTQDLSGKRIFVRGDLNVPLVKTTIADDQRLRALKPTLDEIIHRGGIVILGTHLGRPTRPTPGLSTKLLVSWFKAQGYQIAFLSDFHDMETVLQKKPDIILLENLRFYAGEQSKTEHEKKTFAQQLAQLASYYVNDAFGLLHRSDTSITLLPHLFSADKRTLGLLIDKERAALDRFLLSDIHPFLLIIGGNKLSSKLPLIEALLDRVDTIAWCPAPVFTLIKSQGGSTGRSYVETDALKAAQNFLKQAKEKNVSCLFPTDYQVSYGSLEEPLSYITATEIPPSALGISIGPETINEYCKHISNAQLVLYNGLMGMLEYPKTLHGVQELFTAMAHSNALSIIAGGDSVAAAQALHITGIDYLSTGGGATLAYMNGKSLPGLSAFTKN